MKHCSECDNEIKQGDKFCSNCSSKISSEKNIDHNKMSHMQEKDKDEQIQQLKQRLAVGMIMMVFLAAIVGFFAFTTGNATGYTQGVYDGYTDGYSKGKTTGTTIGYNQGNAAGTSYGKNEATNKAVDCLNKCNANTGIVNQCYSLNCIKTCFGNI